MSHPLQGYAPVTYSYLGALLFGKVLDEALSDNADLTDGAAFAQRFLRRTVQTSIGSYHINANGETEISLAVSYFNHSTSVREVNLLQSDLRVSAIYARHGFSLQRLQLFTIWLTKPALVSQ